MNSNYTEITSLNAINHILKNKPLSILELHLPKDFKTQRLSELYEIAMKNSVKCNFSSSNKAVTAIIKKFQYEKLENFNFSNSKSIVIALDHLQDPQNFGAICRTAEAFGCHAVLIPKDRSTSVSQGVYAASAGAVETIPIIQVTNLASALKIFQEAGYWVIGSTLNKEATTIWELKHFAKSVLVLGAEHSGIRVSTEKSCDVLMYIPMCGKVQSLNVSAAAAIFIYEMYQKNQKGLPE